MNKVILIANLTKPYPSRTGTHNRCLQLIKFCKALNLKVILFGSDIYEFNTWTMKSKKDLETELGIKAYVYFSTEKERIEATTGYIKWDNYYTTGLVSYFENIVDCLAPDYICINYVYWAPLLTQKVKKKAICIIDSIDLISLYHKMAERSWKILNSIIDIKTGKYLLKEVPNDFLSENFYSETTIFPDKSEFDFYDKFDLTIAINEKESKIITENTRFTKSIYLPFSFPTNKFTNKTYRNPPVFVIGPNQFNYQGYLYFVKRVLPIILKKQPDFCLYVIGDGCKNLEPLNGIRLLGFVKDLHEIYETSKFSICPLIGATGQQLKVMEAMANGMAVIALKNVAERCPLIHGENSLIAVNAEEFAEYTLLLNNDPILCEKLGVAAKWKIESSFNTDLIQSKFSSEISAFDNYKVKRSKFKSYKLFWFQYIQYYKYRYKRTRIWLNNPVSWTLVSVANAENYFFFQKTCLKFIGLILLFIKKIVGRRNKNIV